MKAAEIRNEFQSNQPCFQPNDEGSVRVATIKVLAEVAAQLAELNANMSVGNALRGGSGYPEGII